MLTDTQFPGAGPIFPAFFLVIVVFELALVGVTVVAFWKIVSKAGYEGALSLLALVPIANFVMLLVFAFSDWPVLQQMRSMTGAQAVPPPPPMPPSA